MAEVKINVLDDGPFLVKGKVEVVDGQGKTLDIQDECYLCRCGLSTNQPYCTGAHEGKFKNQVRKK